MLRELLGPTCDSRDIANRAATAAEERVVPRLLTTDARPQR